MSDLLLNLVVFTSAFFAFGTAIDVAVNRRGLRHAVVINARTTVTLPVIVLVGLLYALFPSWPLSGWRLRYVNWIFAP